MAETVEIVNLEKGGVYPLLPTQKGQERSPEVMSPDGRRLLFNITGKKFEVMASTLQKISDTRLGQIAEMHTAMETPPKEYFFERNPVVFQCVLDYFVTGELHTPSNVCGEIVLQELDFWGVDIGVLSQCCTTTFSNSTQNTNITKYQKEMLQDMYNLQEVDSQGRVKINSVFSKAWRFMDQPTSSWFALGWALFVTLIIVLDVILFMLGTHPQFKTYKVLDSSKPTGAIIDDSEERNVISYFTAFQFAAVIFFTIELILKVIVVPRKLAFFVSAMTLVDVVCTVATWVVLVFVYLLSHLNFTLAFTKFLSALHILRVIRLFRLFYYMRHFGGQRVLFYSFKSSVKELVIIILVFCTSAIFFSTAVYLAEADKEDSHFDSIISGMWWAVITLSTVGYGDMRPIGVAGRFVGTIAAFWGLTLMLLWLPVVVYHFRVFYAYHYAATTQNKRNKFMREVGLGLSLGLSRSKIPAKATC